jgi:hypothetical protein
LLKLKSDTDPDTDTGTDTDTDTGTNTDTDIGTDTDTGTDIGTDTDTDTGTVIDTDTDTDTCTLTANSQHGIRYCDMDMVKHDLLQRKAKVSRMNDVQKRKTMELMLREEEEWEQLVMYRRDTRFAGVEGEYSHKLQLDRTILDCTMRS